MVWEIFQDFYWLFNGLITHKWSMRPYFAKVSIETGLIYVCIYYIYIYISYTYIYTSYIHICIHHIYIYVYMIWWYWVSRKSTTYEEERNLGFLWPLKHTLRYHIYIYRIYHYILYDTQLISLYTFFRDRTFCPRTIRPRFESLKLIRLG